MDTFILALSTAALFTVGYAIFWTVRAVRRVGPRRFARALGALVWAVLVACFKLFRPDPAVASEISQPIDLRDGASF